MSRSDKSQPRANPKHPAAPERGPSNIIEFIDSQDPNTKSAIQRHTAQHAAAQRREARLQALRDGSRNRRLEWQRRPSSEEAIASASSGSSNKSPPTVSKSASISPNRISRVRSLPPSNETEALTQRENTGTKAENSLGLARPTEMMDGFEESMIEYYVSQRCEFAKGSDFNNLIMSIRRDVASSYLLIAYALAYQSLSQAEGFGPKQHAESMEYRSRGQSILMQRLQDPLHAAADDNIQAVLILIGLVQDFGDQAEASIHLKALENMVEQRGGLEQFEHNPILKLQFQTLPTTRVSHLTLDCGSNCSSPLRFPKEARELSSSPSKSTTFAAARPGWEE